MHETYRLPNGMVIQLQMNSVDQILKDRGMDPNGDAQMFHTQNVLRRMVKYMPFKTGMTIKVTIAQTDIRKPRIITNTPYAKMLFHGIVMVDPKTGAAGFMTEEGEWRSRKGVKKVPSGRPINYDKSKNPLAGPRWDKRLSAAEGPAMARELKNYIARRHGK